MSKLSWFVLRSASALFEKDVRWVGSERMVLTQDSYGGAKAVSVSANNAREEAKATNLAIANATEFILTF